MDVSSLCEAALARNYIEYVINSTGGEPAPGQELPSDLSQLGSSASFSIKNPEDKLIEEQSMYINRIRSKKMKMDLSNSPLTLYNKEKEDLMKTRRALYAIAKFASLNKDDKKLRRVISAYVKTKKREKKTKKNDEDNYYTNVSTACITNAKISIHQGTLSLQDWNSFDLVSSCFNYVQVPDGDLPNVNVDMGILGT